MARWRNWITRPTVHAKQMRCAPMTAPFERCRERSIRGGCPVSLASAIRPDRRKVTDGARLGDWHNRSSGDTTADQAAGSATPDLATRQGMSSRIVRRTNDQKPIVPNGFEVNLFASDLDARGSFACPNAMCSWPKVRRADSGAAAQRNQASQSAIFASTCSVRSHRLLSAGA